MEWIQHQQKTRGPEIECRSRDKDLVNQRVKRADAHTQEYGRRTRKDYDVASAHLGKKKK